MPRPRSRARRPSRRWLPAGFLPALLALVLAACAGSAPPPSAGAERPQPRRVVLISLDGAGARTVQDLHARGALDQGGFKRFLRDGQVADALIPANPTLTSVAHISLATGFAPGATGIVGNQFHPAGSPTGQRASGFAVPIGTETLWEAARRQGKRVGVLTWPGADGEGERRRGDWGLIYNNGAESGPRVFTLAAADWRPAAAPERVVSYSSPRAARVTLGGEGDAASWALDLLAVDGTDDRTVNYDRVIVAPAVSLQAGGWGQVVWPQPDGSVSSRLKLLALAPDLSHSRLFVDGVYRTLAYPAGFAQGLARDGLHWPGSPDNRSLAAHWQGEPGIDLDTWTEQAGHMAAFLGGALRWAAAREDWDLLMGYLPVIDQAGHQLLLVDERQPGFSRERRDELARARERVWQAVDAELDRLLTELDLTRTTVVVVSDHGMVPVHTLIDPNAPLAELGLLATEPEAAAAADGPTAFAIADGGAAHVHVEADGDAAAAAARMAVLTRIADRYADWRVDGEAPVERAFTRQEAARIGLDHPNGGDLILFAHPGFLFRHLPESAASAPSPLYGGHGHLGTHPEVQALYMAIGAGVRPGRGGALHATEVARRVAAWLGIEPPRRSLP